MNTNRSSKLIPVFGNSFDGSDVTAVRSVLQSHMVGAGTITGKFEAEFSRKIGFKHACAVTSCTNGIWLLLKALRFNPEDEIIVPNIHFFGIKNIMDLLGIKYKIADVGTPVPNITLKAIRDNLTPKTKAIVFLEYGGYPLTEIDKIRKYLLGKGRQDVLLILDAANSPFTMYRGRYSALSYDFAVYSFDMNKILVTGDGGLVLSNHKRTIDSVKSLACLGIAGPLKSGFERSKTESHWWEIGPTRPSLKLVMNNVTAALGLSQLNKIDSILEKRAKLAKSYRKLLEPLESQGLVRLPPVSGAIENTVYFFWLTVKNETTRDKLAEFLLKNNVYTTVRYQPLDRSAVTPHAFDFYSRSLIIPLNQNITRQQQEYIVQNIGRFFNYES